VSEPGVGTSGHDAGCENELRHCRDVASVEIPFRPDTADRSVVHAVTDIAVVVALADPADDEGAGVAVMQHELGLARSIVATGAVKLPFGAQTADRRILQRTVFDLADIKRAVVAVADQQVILSMAQEIAGSRELPFRPQATHERMLTSVRPIVMVLPP
jgi:hypothetical protein